MNQKPKYPQRNSQSHTNNGFWDRQPQDRAYRMEQAAQRGRVSNFFDLSPEERARAYDNDYDN